MKLINRAPPPLRSYIFSSLHFLRLFKDLKIPGEGEGGGWRRGRGKERRYNHHFTGGGTVMILDLRILRLKGIFILRQ